MASPDAFTTVIKTVVLPGSPGLAGPVTLITKSRPLGAAPKLPRPAASTPTVPAAETPAVAPLALQRKGAAASLAISPDTFDRRVRPHVRCCYLGSLRLWPVSELQAFLDRESVAPYDGPDN